MRVTIAGTRTITGPDQVLSVTNWWDGPLEGVALFEGSPHRFARVEERKHSRGYSGVFKLTALSEETAALEAEQWAQWLRWRRAWEAGETPRETHPALPGDAARSKEICAMLAAAPTAEPVRRVGVFYESRDALRDCSARARVRWSKS